MTIAPARHVVVVDGSNLATEGRTTPSLRQLDEAVRAYAAEDPTAEIVVVVDASFEHRIDPSEREQLIEAQLHGEVVSPPAGAIGRGDAFVLRIAERTGASVLSNDSFQEFHAEHPWLFDRDRLFGGKPVPGVGWIFTPRIPVRGPKSRQSLGKAKGDVERALSPPLKAAELAKAAKRMAARRAPVLPDGSTPKVGDVWPVVSAGGGAPGTRAKRARRGEPAAAAKKSVPKKEAAAKAAAEAASKKVATKREAVAKAAATKVATKREAAEKAPATKAAAKKDAATKAAAKKVAAADKETGARNAAAATKKAGKKAAPSRAAKKEAARTEAAAKTVAKKAAAKKAAAKKEAAEKTGEQAAKASTGGKAPAKRRAEEKARADAVPTGPTLVPLAADGASKTVAARGTAAKDPVVLEAIDRALAEAIAPAPEPATNARNGRGDNKRGKRKEKDREKDKEKDKEKEKDGPNRRRRSASPPPAVNEPLAFITFVATYPLERELEGEVVSFTSHGAMVDVDLPGGGVLHSYIPLTAMGDPPPAKARQVLTRGERRRFVLVALDPPRRVAELALPDLATSQSGAGR